MLDEWLSTPGLPLPEGIVPIRDFAKIAAFVGGPCLERSYFFMRLIPREQRNASYWIHLFYCDQKKADAVIGDLDELLHDRLKRYGKKKALRWYRAQVAWSLFSLLRPLVPRILGIAAIRELWHRILR
jgi:hypothetical protein